MEKRREDESEEAKEGSEELGPTGEECLIHRLPIVVDDSIRGQKYCRVCLLDFVEGDDLRTKRRGTLLQTVETMLKQLETLNDGLSRQQPTVATRFSELARQSDGIFEAILAGISAEREQYRKQLYQRRTVVQDTLFQSQQRVAEYNEGLAKLRDLLKKPLSATPADLVAIEHQARSYKKGLLMEEKKVAGIRAALYDSEVANDYNEDRLKEFVRSCIKMNLVDKVVERSSMYSPESPGSEQLPDIMGPNDSVSENFEPVIFKFVWNTRQADCYQVLKNIFCTLTIPTVVSKDPEVHSAAFVIPKFSKSIVTEYNRVYLTGGAKLDTMAPIKYTFEFELETLKLYKKSNMKTGRYHHAAVYTTNFIYVSGGSGGAVTLNSCERYDVSHDTWVEMAKMTYPRSCHSLCIFGELALYALFGLVSNDTVANSVERYEIVNDVWTPVNLRLPKTFHSMRHMGSYTIGKDEILIFGGADGSSAQFSADGYVFFPAIGDLQKTEKLKNATIFRNQPVCYKNRVYSFGVDNSIHVFDIKTRKWQQIYDKLS